MKQLKDTKYPLKAINYAIYAVIVLVSIAIAYTGWAFRLSSSTFQNIEGQVVDIQHRWRGFMTPNIDHKGENKGLPIKLLMIDDKTVRELGLLPIDRRYIAKAVNMLAEDKAKLIVFDMIFSEASRRDVEADEQFAAAIANAKNVVLPFELGQQPGKTAEIDLADYLLDNALTQYSNQEAAKNIPLNPNRILYPIPLFGAKARALGHVSALPGSDGALRFDQPVLKFQDEYFPSLALVAARLALDPNRSERFVVRFGDYIQFGNQTLPLDPYSRQIIQYYGPGQTFPTYSLTDFIHGRLDKGIFADSLVLIGGTAVGASDHYPSPFDAALPGTERLATAIDNLQHGHWLERPYWAKWIELLTLLMLPIMVILLVARLRMLWSISILLLVFTAIVGLVQYSFVYDNNLFRLVFPVTSGLIATAGAIAYRAFIDEKNRQTAEINLQASEARYALAAQGANDGLWDWDIQANTVFFSERWLQLMSIDSQSKHLVTMDDWYACLDQHERERFRQQINAHLEGATNKLYHVVAYKANGQNYWLLVRGVAVIEEGKPTRMAGSITDITEQKSLQKQIQVDALFDRLTGLSNYYPFLERLRALFRQSMVVSGVSEVGLVIVDINGFRLINDKYSQLLGNEVLHEVANRLTVQFKNQTLARTGGDQFMIAYSGAMDLELAEQARAIFDQNFRLGQDEEKLQAAIATAHTEQGLETVDELLNGANLTLALAKQRKVDKVQVFDPKDRAVEQNRRWLSVNIDRALRDGDQFKMYYQPFIRLSDRKLLGFESLIRWHHPERGFIVPDSFIPYAEESGQINAIGQWVMQQTVADMLTWQDVGFEGEIAINISSRQFTDQDLTAIYAQLKEQLPPSIPCRRLKLEVTESMSMANPQRATDILTELTEMGYKISIDDFGTGYSSLAYLHRFPFHTLKVDQSFVRRLDAGREVQEIVRTIATLGQTLNKQVLAEGIETEAHARLLEEVGVEVGQGWLFAKAMNFDDATEFIKNNQQAVATTTSPPKSTKKSGNVFKS